MSFLAKTAFAQTVFQKVQANSAISGTVSKIIDAIVIPLVLGLFLVATVVFVWGVFGLISHADEPTARSEGQLHILWGVIGMAIMFSAYGIIRVIAHSTGFSGDPFS